MHHHKHRRAERCGPEGRGSRAEAHGRHGRRHGFAPEGDFGGDAPYGRRGGFGRGQRQGKRFAGDELRLMVLFLLGEAPQHGYQLIRTFAEKSGDAYSPSPGVLYPLLTLLQDMGLIEEAPGEGRTRSFALTDQGKAELETGKERAEAALARLSAMAQQAEQGNAAPIRRAMMNLRTAAMQRLSQDDADKETAFAVAALLDDAAQKIERL